MLNRLLNALKSLFWTLAGAALVIFAISNRDPVTLSFRPFITSVDVPEWAVLFAGVLLGLLLSGMVTGGVRLRNFAKLRQAERRVKELDVKASELAEDAHEAHAKLAHTAASDKNHLTS